jgi:hypothetical protein
MPSDSNGPKGTRDELALKFHVLVPKAFDIAPAERRRDWMDNREGYAYRCLPLSMANAHGWVIRCVEAFEAEWDGSADPKGITLHPMQTLGPDNLLKTAESHFGEGILTFLVKAIVRTPPGYNLWISGVPNQLKDGIQALSALVECDWMPYTFTMNWKFTRKNFRVRFEIGEPMAFIFPIQRGILQSMQPMLYDAHDTEDNPDNPELINCYRPTLAWRGISRKAEATWPERPEGKLWQRWYMRGKIPFTGRAFKDHERTITLKPLIDHRKRTKSNC